MGQLLNPLLIKIPSIVDNSFRINQINAAALVGLMEQNSIS